MKAFERLLIWNGLGLFMWNAQTEYLWLAWINNLDQFGIPPHSFDSLPLKRNKLAEPLDFVLVEIAFEYLSVGQLDASSALLGVLDERALIILPEVLQIVKVGVVEAAFERLGVVVVDLA